MTTDIKEKIVLITGASEGIGRETALAFARAGAKVIAVARNKEKLAELFTQLAGNKEDHLIFSADVNQRPMMEILFSNIKEKYGRLDVLILNAAVGYHTSLEKMKMDILRRLFETNYFSTVLLTQIMMPLLEKSKGLVMFISSVIGRVSVPFHSAYCSSKFALEGLAEAIRPELGVKGVKVSVFCPPLVATSFSKNSFREEPPKKKWNRPFEPDYIARRILKNARKPKRDVVVSFGGHFLIFMHRYFPRFVDYLLTKYQKVPKE